MFYYKNCNVQGNTTQGNALYLYIQISKQELADSGEHWKKQTVDSSPVIISV